MTTDLADKRKNQWKKQSKNSDILWIPKVLIGASTNRGFLQHCVFSWSLRECAKPLIWSLRNG